MVQSLNLDTIVETELYSDLREMSGCEDFVLACGSMNNVREAQIRTRQESIPGKACQI
jgi:hypothetical protein